MAYTILLSDTRYEDIQDVICLRIMNIYLGFVLSFIHRPVALKCYRPPKSYRPQMCNVKCRFGCCKFFIVLKGPHWRHTLSKTIVINRIETSGPSGQQNMKNGGWNWSDSFKIHTGPLGQW